MGDCTAYDRNIDYSDNIEKLLKSIEKNIDQLRIDHAKLTRKQSKKVKFTLQKARTLEDKVHNNSRIISSENLQNFHNSASAIETRNLSANSLVRPHYDRYTFRNSLPLHEIYKLITATEELEKKKKIKSNIKK